MSRDEYEPERIALLEERRRDEAESEVPDYPSLESRYGPGTFGCHEGVHVTKLVVDLIEDKLVNHGSVILNPYWFYCVREAQQLLYAAYSAVGGEHLGAPRPGDAGLEKPTTQELEKMSTPTIQESPFPWPDEEKGYHLFPAAMESDSLVAFHGTARSNLAAIVAEGFKFTAKLQSLSFAKESSYALSHACARRSETSPEGCVIAVRFSAPIPRSNVAVETSDIHVYDLAEQPEVIGYCIVPADYVWR
ncbi:hypothetical protein [Mesorhizobium sp. L-2-11]|uniref:hypothetical protein n=1 Tax=Mesorhizobium sp. L-2-11 TaxID=2744521 RepID=UPI00192717CD|nr:hypothetical protein [Mesorhizobium sp. L-2-11]BCH14946.1 hypothetical protein MesoLjLa_17970 [Mesorhizobium sp. L-2-11]